MAVIHASIIHSNGMSIFPERFKTMFEFQRDYIDRNNHVPKSVDSFIYNIIVCKITQFKIHHSRNVGDTLSFYPYTKLVQLFHLKYP